MQLSGTVVVAVLLGALLHAVWNALIKSGKDKSLDTALIHSLGFFFALPVLLFTGLPAAASWPFLAASAVVHLGYFAAIAGAYKHGDLGLTYPIMRGSAPLLVALASYTFIGEAISFTAWLGVAAIGIGVIALGLSRSVLQADEAQRRKALAFALSNAVIIALYTVIDGLGVRASGNPIAYVAALTVVDGFPFMALVLWQRGSARGAALRYMAGRWKLASVGALATVASYGIALWAMTQAPVATVAALRETSVLFAALIGSFFLGEKFGLQRVVGTLIILSGVMLLRLSH